jgi:2-polyprenyl-3-methyl-5-hydroxy-6-metoxy-1,4-benzoquinol methylase
MAMNYRARIYEKYFSNIQKQSEQLDLIAIDRLGRAYDVYLRGWLPADKNAAILDVGCGYGCFLRFLSKRGYTNAAGVDVSAEQVELARKINQNVVEANALEFLEAHVSEFDLIVSIEVIEHFRKDEVVRFLDVCYNALRPQGRLIIQTPNADSPFCFANRYGDFTHETCFNLRSLANLMKLYGFTAIEGRELGPIPCGLFSSVRWLLWKLVRLSLLAYNMIETGSQGSNIFSRVFIASGVKQ